MCQIKNGHVDFKKNQVKLLKIKTLIIKMRNSEKG